MKIIRKPYPKVREYRKSGNTYFQVDLRRKNYTGRKKFKNFNEKTAALKYASELGDNVAQHGLNSLQVVQSPRLAAFEKQCAMFGKTPEDAVKLAVDFWLTEKAKLESPFVTELLTVWVDDKRTGVKQLRPISIAAIKSYSALFKEFFGNKRIIEITSETIEAYLKSKETSPQTKKNNLRYMQNFFNWAIKKKLHNENPAEYWLTQIVIPKKTIGFYSVEQCKEIMKIVMKPENKDILAYYALGLFAGIRPDELEKMTWKNILFETKEIFISSDISKTKADRQFEMSPTLFTWLNYCKDIRPLIPKKNLRRSKNKVMGKISFSAIADGLRHTFATFHFAENRNYEKLRSIMGNSPNIIEKHYKGIISVNQIAGFNAITPETLPNTDTKERVAKILAKQ